MLGLVYIIIVNHITTTNDQSIEIFFATVAKIELVVEIDAV